MSQLHSASGSLPIPVTSHGMGMGERPKLQCFELDNGMQVVLQEDLSTSLVAVYVAYRSGSSRDPDGGSGLAHLCEHLSFLGPGDASTGDHPLAQDPAAQGPRTENLARLVERMGGLTDARTSHDRTSYGCWMAAEMLDLALWVESRRMVNPVSGLSASTLAREQAIIGQELRQTFERPYGRALATIQRQVYGDRHPYGRMPIGTAEGVAAATESDVEGFFRRFYQPCQAVLVVAGQVDFDAARRRIEHYFGSIPAGRLPPLEMDIPGAPVVGGGTMEDSVPYPRAYVAWPAPSFGSGQRALAGLLANCWAGRDRPLQQRLVKELGIAQSVKGLTVTMHHAVTLIFSATGQRGVDPEELREALLESVQSQCEQGVEASMLAEVSGRTVTDHLIDQRYLQHRADRLAQWAAFGIDPMRLGDEAERLRAVQATDLEAYASEICRADRCTHLTVVPA